MRVWDSDDFCLTEAASILELVNAINELQFDLTGYVKFFNFPSEISSYFNLYIQLFTLK